MPCPARSEHDRVPECSETAPCFREGESIGQVKAVGPAERRQAGQDERTFYGSPR